MNEVAQHSTAPIAPARDYLVRHGAMRYYGVYNWAEEADLERGAVVILRTERGTEQAEVLCPATPEVMQQIPDPTHGKILRRATEHDLATIANLPEVQSREYDLACQLVKQHRLAMQIVNAEHLFGGERLLFYFLSETRVDFRDLVKSMAREFNTRIELRQIGVRDEAKLKADYGDCGKPVCCNTFLVVMPPVSMRMAKLQKSTLDPTKISGRCGRLKCCLRYEQDVYEQHQAEMPAIGSRIVTREGQGRVLGQEVLARRLLVEFEDGRRVPISADDVLTQLK